MVGAIPPSAPRELKRAQVKSTDLPNFAVVNSTEEVHHQRMLMKETLAIDDVRVLAKRKKLLTPARFKKLPMTCSKMVRQLLSV